jgi:hypothetical protein
LQADRIQAKTVATPDDEPRKTPRKDAKERRNTIGGIMIAGKGDDDRIVHATRLTDWDRNGRLDFAAAK